MIDDLAARWSKFCYNVTLKYRLFVRVLKVALIIATVIIGLTCMITSYTYLGKRDWDMAPSLIKFEFWLRVDPSERITYQDFYGNWQRMRIIDFFDYKYANVIRKRIVLAFDICVNRAIIILELAVICSAFLVWLDGRPRKINTPNVVAESNNRNERFLIDGNTSLSREVVTASKSGRRETEIGGLADDEMVW